LGVEGSRKALTPPGELPMDFYIVVEIDEEDGSWYGDPVTFDDRVEAFKHQEQQKPLAKGLCFAVYECREIFK
jgi:hypothetical protein